MFGCEYLLPSFPSLSLSFFSSVLSSFLSFIYQSSLLSSIHPSSFPLSHTLELTEQNPFCNIKKTNTGTFYICLLTDRLAFLPPCSPGDPPSTLSVLEGGAHGTSTLPHSSPVKYTEVDVVSVDEEDEDTRKTHHRCHGEEVKCFGGVSLSFNALLIIRLSLLSTCSLC